jgi:hypothetical protein
MTRPHRRTLGAAEVGLAVVLAALTLGAVIGNGLARTAVDIPDGFTWFADDRRGEVVQVNPETAAVDTRLRTGQPGEDLDIAQRNGQLVITNRATGALMVIDLSTLLVSGQRQATAGQGATKVLLSAGRIYLAELGRGELYHLDPLSTATIGQPLVTGGGFADAAVDGQDVVWLLAPDGMLTGVRWSPDAKRFVRHASRPVTGAGQDARLVVHDAGVTVFGPEEGVVVRFGTGQDLTARVPGLRGQVSAAEKSPATLAPASAEGVVVVARADRVLEIKVSNLMCANPGEPVVFRNEVWVPCLGARKVLILTPDGQRARADLILPEGGNPEMVLDDGRLLITVADADTGVVVDASGATKTVKLYDEGVPVRDPTARTSPATRPATRQPASVPASMPAAAATTVRPTRSPLPPSPALTRTSAPAAPVAGGGPPTGASATADGSGSVTVRWSRPNVTPSGYTVRCDTCGGGVLATVGGGATSAVVTTVQPGTTTRFVVRAEYGPRGYDSAPSNAVTVFTRPGAPGGVGVFGETDNGGFLDFTVGWSGAADNGRPITGYAVDVSGGGDRQNASVPGGTTSATMRLTCAGGCDGMVVDVSVVASNAAGTGPATGTTFVYQAPPPVPVPSTSPRTLPPTRPPISRGPTGRPIDTSPAAFAAAAPSGGSTATLLVPPALLVGLAGAVFAMGRRRRYRESV